MGRMIRSQKTRIYPTEIQKDLIEKSFGLARYGWNIALQESIGTKIYSGYTLRNQFVALVKPDRPWISIPSKEAYANSIIDLGKAWKRFFDNKRNTRKGFKVGTPKFKSKKWSKQSFRMESYKKGNLTWVGKEIKVPKFTGNKKFLPKIKAAEIPRWQNGEVKAVTISRHGDKYFASVRFDVQNPVNTRPIQSNGGTVGIDWGVKTLLTLSDGTIFPAQDFKKIDRKIKKYQRVVSHKKLGSRNREKARTKLNRKTSHKTNMIEDYLNKASSFIVRNYSDIKIEDLHPSNMMKNHNLARRIGDGSFYKFKEMLTYKVEQLQNEYGKNVALELVSARDTTQICSLCGEKHNNKITLNVRKFHCDHCGFTIDRDLNAAINIANK